MNKLIDIILITMKPHLNSNQLSILQVTLNRELSQYDLKEKYTIDLVVVEDQWKVDLRDFLLEKQIEGKSIKTLKQYKGHLFKLFSSLNKNIEFLKTTSKALIVIPLILMLPIVVNFEGSFVLFHKTMFNNDYWIFDPNLDPVINILPEEFFFHAGLMILILIIIASLTNYLIYRFLKREQ